MSGQSLTVSGRIIISLIFIISALTKIFPVEPLEYAIAGSGLAGWAVSPFLARIIIIIELFAGLMLAAGIFRRITLKLSLILLSFFTIYLSILLITEGNSNNCGCFGNWIFLTPLESVFKNIVMIMLCLILLKWQSPGPRSLFVRILPAIFLVISSAFVFIVNPVKIGNNSAYVYEAGKKLDFTRIGNIKESDGTEVNLAEGKKIVMFMTVKCKFCRLAAGKISIMQKRLGYALPVYYVFFGDESYLYEFWEASGSFHFPYKFVPPQDVIAVAGNHFPAIYFLDNGIVSSRFDLLTMNEEYLKFFLGN